MRHIIIEGPDGAGKTHLARRLCHRHAMAYHHEGPPPKGGDLLHHYAGLLANAARPTVFDRLHLGELVYGPLLRGGSGLAPTDITLINRLIRGAGMQIIVCAPPRSTCLANNRVKTEMIESEVLRGVAYDTWCFIVNNPDLLVNGTVYDYTRDNGMPEDCPARLPDGVIGAPSADTLLIGEQPNSDTLDLPFFGRARSSGYLNDRLADAGYDEFDLAFTNALDMRGNARDLAFIVSQMPRLKRVITLGRTAANQVERQNVPFVTIEQMPHPAFWKRFHFGETEEYTRMLRRIRAAS